MPADDSSLKYLFVRAGILPSDAEAISTKIGNTGSSGAATGVAAPQPLGIATPGTATAASHEDHVHAMPTAAQVNALGLPISWDAAANSPQLVSSTAPTGNNAYVVTNPGSTNLNGITIWSAGDIAYFSNGGVWQRIAAPPATGTSLAKYDGGGGFANAVAGVDYTPAPAIQTAVPIGLAPGGTAGNNGAITGVTLPVAYSAIWFYFPAGALYAGSLAGFYFCTATTTTITVYANYIAATTAGMGLGGSTANWNIPASPTPIVATGPGAYLQTTSSVFTPGILVPANSLGAHGSIETHIACRQTNSAGAKTVQVCFGKNTTFTTVNAINAGSSAQNAQVATLYCRGVPNAQIMPSSQDSAIFGFTGSSIDTTQDQYVQVRLTNPNTSEPLVLEFIKIIVVPQP